MNEWGNNPATYEAIGSVVGAIGVLAVFISTLLAWRSLHETRAQRQATEREFAVRMRPWVGLFGFGYNPSESRGGMLHLLLRNFGPLPAQRANLSLVLRPLKPIDKEPDNPIRREEQGTKALLPEEEGNYVIDLSPYPQFAEWRTARRDVRVEGIFKYSLDQFEFKTEMEGMIWFSESPQENGQEVKINWRNKEAS
jgi:hypothetical protein